MTERQRVDILMIGHFAQDRLVVDGQAQTASGGGVYYGGMALRRLGLSVAVVTRLHADDFTRLEAMKQAGIQVYATPALQTSGIENIYDSTDMERRICKPLGFAGAMGRDEVPDLQAAIIAVTPIIAGEVDLPLLRELAQRGPLALDVQGFVRVRDGDDLVFREWPEMAEGLSLVTYLKVDRAEAELLTEETDLAAAAARLASYGPREIVVTESAGVTVLAEGQLHQAPFRPRALAGRTGRGDTCFASYLGWRLAHSPRESAWLAAAVTTLKQEQPGPWQGSPDDAAELLKRWAAEGIGPPTRG